LKVQGTTLFSRTVFTWRLNEGHTAVLGNNFIVRLHLGGIGEQGISGDITVCPCPIRASLAIGHPTGAEDIVESDDRLTLAV
jgi:hypothetical protein